MLRLAWPLYRWAAGAADAAMVIRELVGAAAVLSIAEEFAAAGGLFARQDRW